MSKVTFFIRGSDSGSRFKRPWTSRILSLLALALVLGASAPAQSGPPPGSTDPVGSPAYYTILRGDDLALDPQNQDPNNPNSVQTFPDGNLDSPSIKAGLGLIAPYATTVMAAGRIFSQGNDQLINVGRPTSNPSQLGVESPSGAPTQTYYLKGLHAPIPNTPDLISVAVGDLDKVADKNGVNHDEVVVAYAQGAPPGSLQVNLAVLNYTSTQPINASQPLFVTQVLSPYPIDKPLDHQAHSQISELFAVAIGDFDGDGQNEIALATLGPDGSSQVNLSIFRYVHKLLTDTPSLVLVSSQQIETNNLPGPTISLLAGDFAGTHKKAELVLALMVYDLSGPTPNYQTVFGSLWAIDVKPTAADPTKLTATLEGDIFLPAIALATNEPIRIKALAGLFFYDPEHGFDLYRREIAVVSAARNSLDITFALLTIESGDFDFQTSDSTQNGNGSLSFTVTAGALSPSPSIDSPLWKIAIENFTSRGAREITEYSPPPAYSFPQAQPELTNDWLWPCALCKNVIDNDMDDNSLRPPLQAYDYRGRTVLLGAPFRITFDNLINTDFVLQEPPKHAYWDEAQKKLVIVSRVPGINVSMTNKQGVTFSGMSTDTSAHSEGGSDAVSAGASAGGGFLGLFDVSASVEATEKSSYNYKTNKSSYNSNYSSRSLSEAESTDNDDFVSGRMQGMNIWRYRVLGVPGTVDGKPVNTFYDLLLPGTTVKFNGSGLDFDWYQPIHENGNILSYPSPSSDDPSSPPAFKPPDLGTYEIPCPQPGAPDCKNGKLTASGAMIPAMAEFMSATSDSIRLDYSNNTGSGNTISYQHTTGTSTDVKVGFSAKGSIFGATIETNASYEHNFDSSDSWGNAQTSDTSTTSDTGIMISRAEINASLGYEFFPTVYTTLDGTIKVAHAVDPLGSRAGKLFWAGLYGGKPDPALNLPLRFVRDDTNWIPNTLISRKQMRGFFVMSENPNPVTLKYDILGLAPVDGDQVRLSAQVYNYSTAKRFDNCLVQFYTIKLDPDTEQEIPPRQLIGTTHISLLPRATAPAQIIWNTKGSAPNGQLYRIYVRLNYDGAIKNENYPPEMPGTLDPGQNNEGFGEVTVMAPATHAQPATVSFGSTPLAMVWSGHLFTQNLAAPAGVRVELTSQICTSSDSRDPVDLMVFDGNPSKGHVIAWKRIYVPNHNKCKRTRFSWRPTRGLHQLTAIINPNSAPSKPIVGANSRLTAPPPLTRASLEVNVP